LGARAVELILSDKLAVTHTEYLPTELIERESVRRIEQ
jgi:hypothetical protein